MRLKNTITSLEYRQAVKITDWQGAILFDDGSQLQLLFYEPGAVAWAHRRPTISSDTWGGELTGEVVTEFNPEQLDAYHVGLQTKDGEWVWFKFAAPVSAQHTVAAQYIAEDGRFTPLFQLEH